MCEGVLLYRTQRDRVYAELKTQRIILFERHITADQKSLGYCLPLCVQLQRGIMDAEDEPSHLRHVQHKSLHIC